MIKCTEDFDVIKTTINDSPPPSLYFIMNLISFMFSQPENLGGVLKFPTSQARSTFSTKKSKDTNELLSYFQYNSQISQ